MKINQKNDYRIQIVLIALSVIGVTLVLFSTSLYGVHVAPDSVTYISLARNIVAGNGYTAYNGSYVSTFPPLLPLILAFFELFGVDPVISIRFFNVFVFGLIIFTSGQLFLKYPKSKILAILGTASILLSNPLLYFSGVASSEPFFILLIVLFIYYFPKFLLQKNTSYFLLISIIAALSCLQRVLGVSIIIAGCVLIFFFLPDSTFLQKLKYVIIFGVISFAPLGIFLIINYITTGKFTGYTPSPTFALLKNIISSIDVLTAWFVPSSIIPYWLRLIGFCVVLPMIISILIYSHYKIKRKTEIELFQLWLAAIFILIYINTIVVLSSIVRFYPVDNRLVMPVYVFIMLLVFSGVEELSNWLSLNLKIELLKKNIKYIVMGLVSIWLMFPLYVTYDNVSKDMQYGAGGYNTTSWRNSELIEWVKNNQLNCKLYSNAPDAIYFLADIVAQYSPHSGTNISEFKESFQEDVSNYLIWFNSINFRFYLYDIEDLLTLLDLETILVSSDGGIYLIT